MMLASRADELQGHMLSILRPTDAPETKDHMLGFWGTSGLDFAAELSRHSWSTWAVITDTKRAEMTCEHQPYHAMHKAVFLENCRRKADALGVQFLTQEKGLTAHADQLFDSRPPRAKPNAMLQHFVGLEVEMDSPVFDPKKAILMDFRVDQSHGMHFMYVLPFSPTCALVESTMFSTDKMPRSFYVEAIESYLFDHYGASIDHIVREEQGVIPMGNLNPHDPDIPGLGANGGAIRPASGYTFAFLHQQIQDGIERSQTGKPLDFKRPHKRVDVWMDSVLLTVLRHWPNHGPRLFVRMAEAMSGEEFIRFMTGQANWRLRFKVMRAMPKMPFIRGFSKWMFSRPHKVVS